MYHYKITIYDPENNEILELSHKDKFSEQDLLAMSKKILKDTYMEMALEQYKEALEDAKDDKKFKELKAEFPHIKTREDFISFYSSKNFYTLCTDGIKEKYTKYFGFQEVKIYESSLALAEYSWYNPNENSTKVFKYIKDRVFLFKSEEEYPCVKCGKLDCRVPYLENKCLKCFIKELND